jgi:hypothetical protein
LSDVLTVAREACDRKSGEECSELVHLIQKAMQLDDFLADDYRR